RAYFSDFPGGAEGLSTPGASQLMPEQINECPTSSPPRRRPPTPHGVRMRLGPFRSLGRVGEQFHFDPDTYMEMVLAEVPAYRELQKELARAAAGRDVQHVLDLGTGTGETAAVI